MDTKIIANAEQQARIFGALADPTRLKLIKLLCHRCGPNALCVNALAYQLGVTQSAVSQHLRILKSIDLVKGERHGYHIHYLVNWETLETYRALMTQTLNIEAESGEMPRRNCNKSEE